MLNRLSRSLLPLRETAKMQVHLSLAKKKYDPVMDCRTPVSEGNDPGGFEK